MAYNADSIQVRDFRTAARTTPGMYIGADGQDAMFNCFLEILNNACDEAIMGRGKEIIVEVADNEMRITDFGAGVPHGKNKDTEEVLIEIYTSAHSSGKFDSTNYKRVRGMHGIGSSTVCVCSKVFDVWTQRDGAEWFMEFQDGIPRQKTAKKLRATKETGTTIWFVPDKSIFHLDENTPAFDKERVRNELRLTSYFIPGVTFTYRNGDKIEKFLSKNGLKDFAADNITKPLHKQYIYGAKTFDNDIDIEVFAQWTAGHEKCYVFSNGALNSGGGTPVSGMKTAFTRTINDLAKESFDGDMIRKGLVTIINIKHPHPIYQNQVKDKIQNQELRGYTQTAFTEAIKNWASGNTSDFEKIIAMLAKEAKADAAAEKARAAILNHEKEMSAAAKHKNIHSDKLREARKLGQDSMLILVEGNSAGGSVATGRQKATDGDKIGILYLRGKMINALANPIEDVLANEEIKLLLQALGLVYGQKYNSKKLRYGKVAICSDADFDGSHIGLLIMAAIQKLCPEFIEEGRLYWLKAPISKLDNKGKSWYYYTEEEFKERTEREGEITFFKGLGQMNEKDLRLSLFGTNQHLEQLSPTENGIDTLLALMGSEVEPRKEFVQQIDFGGFQL
jgi:DNA gyrase subunit B